MKKVTMSFLLSILVVATITTALAAGTDAQANSIQERLQDNIQEAQEIREEARTNLQERKELKKEVMENIREKLKDGEELTMTPKKLTLRKINSEIMELRTERARIKTRLKLNNEGNASELKAKLSNGRNAEIKIMPETISERAIEKLRLRNCNEENNCTIELKEVGEGNKTRAVYEAKVKKRFRLFGIFKSEKDITTQIDAETGEEIQTKRPWWSWMASEKEIEK